MCIEIFEMSDNGSYVNFIYSMDSTQTMLEHRTNAQVPRVCLPRPSAGGADPVRPGARVRSPLARKTRFVCLANRDIGQFLSDNERYVGALNRGLFRLYARLPDPQHDG